MATTTNYGWTTPDDTALVKDGAAAIRTLGSSVDTTTKNLNPSTTLGDIEYRSSTSNVNTRLCIGSSGQYLTVSGGVPAWTTLSVAAAVNPNLVINGNFTINQRAYVSAANLASGVYGFDRWKSNYTNTTLTFTSAPAGQSITINASGGLQQIVEQANVPAGSYTLSFAGTATGRIYNEGGTPPSYAASPISFTADGLANVVVEFTAVSTTKTLSKVKLELGTSASSFNYSGNTIEGELANCQRYYYRTIVTTITPSFGVGMAYAGTAAIINVPFPTTLRVRPTALEQSGTATDYGLYLPGSSAADCDSVPAFFHSSSNSASMTTSTASGLTAGHATMLLGKTTNAYLGWSAEL
jgi:hypothetical protein